MHTPTPPPFNRQGLYTVHMNDTGITVEEFTNFTGPELTGKDIYLIYGYVVQNNQTFSSFEIKNQQQENVTRAFEIGDKKRILDISQIAVDGHPVFRFHFGDDNGTSFTRFRWYDKKVTGYTVQEGLQAGLNEVLQLTSIQVEVLPPSYPKAQF